MKRLLWFALAVLTLPAPATGTGRTGHTCPDPVRDPDDACITSVEVDTLWRTLSITGVNLSTGAAPEPLQHGERESGQAGRAAGACRAGGTAGIAWTRWRGSPVVSFIIIDRRPTGLGTAEQGAVAVLDNEVFPVNVPEGAAVTTIDDPAVGGMGLGWTRSPQYVLEVNQPGGVVYLNDDAMLRGFTVRNTGGGSASVACAPNIHPSFSYMLFEGVTVDARCGPSNP